MSSGSPSPSTSRRPDLVAWVAIGILAALTLFYVTFVKPRQKSNSGTADPSVGTAYQEFQAVPLLSTEREVAATDFTNHVTVIAYWGPWCFPCTQEMPHLMRMAAQLKGDPRFQFVPVACPDDLGDHPDEFRKEVEQFVNHHQYAGPMYTLTANRLIALNSPALDPALQMAFPTTLVIDGGGKIRGKWVGFDPAYPTQVSDTVVGLLKALDAEKQ